ncbi:hypothetical protein [Streptomyces minutiscleroticus]|uniref:Uncharacterized protein n=1 Tax=Streptomyces minutiscleroticus TaxID=68238 RepID=A0A918NET4_9ACTN|nr:hypothetical protein [Streptomyces minutiscleroticus]GGX65110.1 hypothetical protein GCM10010358_19340 [Streptomyces minutiscleroticus]
MTEKLLGRLSKRPWTERWLIRLLGAALSAAAYLLFIPWDLRDRPEGPGSTAGTTPVTGAGVVALALTLLLLAAYLGRRDARGWPLLLVAAPPTALLYASFRAHPDPDASPWPLTWAFVTLLIAAGTLVAASAARGSLGDEEDAAEGLFRAGAAGAAGAAGTSVGGPV